MAVFASDGFGSGSGDLVGTAPDVGGNWTDGSNSGSPSPIYLSNNIRQEDAATSITYVDTVAPTADYSVQAVITPQAGGCAGVAGVVGRKAAGSGSGNQTCYIADYYDHLSTGSRQWRLYKYVAGAYTGLATYTQNIGTTATTVKLEMIGSAIKLYVNGVERCSATDSSITAAGYAGVMFGAASSPTTNAIYLDDFTTDYTATVASSVLRRRRPSGLYLR